MIARLKGRIDEKSPGEIIVDVGGVGYLAAVSLTTFCRLPDVGDPVSLEIVTISRENALELFGFSDRRERALFELLRGVSGIGPRLALAVLSGLEPDDFVEAVASESVERLVAIPGVGKKTAERIVIELRDKVERDSSAGPAPNPSTQVESDAVLALVALGYKEPQARKAVGACMEDGDTAIESLIKRSLAQLS